MFTIRRLRRRRIGGSRLRDAAYVELQRLALDDVEASQGQRETVSGSEEIDGHGVPASRRNGSDGDLSERSPSVFPPGVSVENLVEHPIPTDADDGVESIHVEVLRDLETVVPVFGVLDVEFAAGGFEDRSYLALEELRGFARSADGIDEHLEPTVRLDSPVLIGPLHDLLGPRRPVGPVRLFRGGVCQTSFDLDEA